MGCLGKYSHHVIDFYPHQKTSHRIKRFLPIIFHDLFIKIYILYKHAYNKGIQSILCYICLVNSIQEISCWILNELINFEPDEVQIETGDES
jgi:hypothetical protein